MHSLQLEQVCIKKSLNAPLQKLSCYIYQNLEQNITIFQNKNKFKLLGIIHDVKFNFSFYQTSNDVIKLIVTKLVADV